MNPICPTCGTIITIHAARYCPSCARDRLLKSLFEGADDDPEEDEDMSPEEAFHDMRRVDWEREQYRRMDEEDRARGDTLEDMYPLEFGDYDDDTPHDAAGGGGT